MRLINAEKLRVLRAAERAGKIYIVPGALQRSDRQVQRRFRNNDEVREELFRQLAVFPEALLQFFAESPRGYMIIAESGAEYDSQSGIATMKVLEWIETDDKFLAVVQPQELFMEGSFFESDRYEYESAISGVLRRERVRDIYAHAFDKRWCSLAEARRIMERMPDYMAENKAREAVESIEAEIEAELVI